MRTRHDVRTTRARDLSETNSDAQDNDLGGCARAHTKRHTHRPRLHAIGKPQLVRFELTVVVVAVD